MSAASQPSKVTFWQGYTVDAEGIRCWPFRAIRYHWADLERVEYSPYTFKGRGRFRLGLVFVPGSARRAEINCGAGLRNLAKISQVLSWARAERPEIEGWQDQLIGDLIRAGNALASWHLGVGAISDEKLFLQAQIRMAALERNAVIKDCRALISHHSDFEVRAARLKIEAELADGKTEDAIDTLAELLTRHPEETEAHDMVASYLIATDDESGPEMARAVFGRDPAKFPALVLNCAAFFVRRKRWNDASELLDRLELVRTRLGAPEREALARYQKDLSELRTDPRRAFREITLGNLRAQFPGYALLLVLLLMFCWPLFSVGPLFYHEAQQLRKLRDHGVRAQVVQGVVRSKLRSRDSHWLTTVSFRLASDRGEVDPLTLKELNGTPPEPVRRWLGAHGTPEYKRLPFGWYGGEAILFDATAQEILRDPKLQIATYLPENPAVNTIGPITNTRIWLTWVGMPSATFPPILLAAVFGGVFARDHIKRRLRKWHGNPELRRG